MKSPPSPPTGDVTFVFTDIEGSTALWDRAPDAMTDSLAEHDRRIRSIVDRHHGFVFSTAGDSFAAAFPAAAEYRLVTLSGAGGAGKTRLAVRVAEELLGNFPDGLRVAELGAVRDADVLVDEIAQRFAVTRVAGTPLVRSMAEYIGAQTVLLGLDNCEQIISPTAGLCQDLLTACPNLCVLATSRERLGVAGEALYGCRRCRCQTRTPRSRRRVDTTQSACSSNAPSWRRPTSP